MIQKPSVTAGTLVNIAFRSSLTHALLKCEEDRGVPGRASGLRRVLEARAGIGKKMVVRVEIVAHTAADRGARAAVPAVGGLMHDLGAELEVGQHLPRQRPTRHAEITRGASAVDLAPAAAEGRPWTPIVLQPDRHEQRKMLVADERGAAGQEHTRKDPPVPPAFALMQEAVFRGEFDIADAEKIGAAAGAVLLHRQDGGQLEVLRGAIIEVHAE